MVFYQYNANHTNFNGGRYLNSEIGLIGPKLEHQQKSTDEMK